MSRGALVGLASACALAAICWLWMADAGSGPTPESEPPPGLADSAAAPRSVDTDQPAPAEDETPRRRPVPHRAPAAPAAGALRIITVDSQGRPVGGVPVSIWQGHSANSQQSIWLGRTDAAGEVAVTDFAGRRKPSAEVGPRFAVVAVVPAPRPAALEFDGEDPPDEPLRLELPPLGRVEVELVDRQGRPLPLTANVRIAAEHVDGAAPLLDLLPEWCDRRMARWLADGKPAVFDKVAVGTSLRAIALLAPGSGRDPGNANRIWTEWSPGPVAAGQTTKLQLELPDRMSVLAGRAVDPRGEALAHRTLRTEVDLTKGWRSERGQCRSDDQGRWATLLRLRAARHGTLYIADCSGEQVGAVTLRDWPAAEILDLGDIELGPGLLAVDGMAVDELGRPLADLPLELLVQTQTEVRGNYRGPRRYSTHRQKRAAVRSDADGHFEFRLPRPEVLAHVQVDHPDYLPFESAAIGFGQRDLLLRLQRAGRVELSVDCGEGRPPTDLIARLLKSDAPPAERDAVPGRGVRMPGNRGVLSTWFSKEEPRRASLSFVPPGVYDLRIARKPKLDEVLATVHRVTVRPGEASDDPRLVDIPISIGKNSYRIRLMDSDDGSPRDARGGSLFYAQGVAAYEESERPGWQSVTINGRELELHSDSPRIQLEIRLEGHLSLSCDLTPGYHEIDCPPGPKVELRLSELHEALAGVPVAVRIVELDAPPKQWRSDQERLRFGEQQVRSLSRRGSTWFLRPPTAGRYALSLVDGSGQRHWPVGTITITEDPDAPTAVQYAADWRQQAAAYREAVQPR